MTSPRRIAIVPAYNEEPTVAAVLEVLYPLVDELVVVDDGSTDSTRAEIEKWMRGHHRVRLLTHDVNQGMSEAYYHALTDLRGRLQRGEVDADDLVFTVDADGQHDLAVLDELTRITVDEHLDAMLARRDLSDYPAYKQLGNWLLSAWASLWAGKRLHDVESGYRIFRLGPLVHALDYYQGYKYSETVEVAVVLCRLGYRVRNDHLVPVPVFRSRTRMRDAAIDLAMVVVAAARVWWRGARSPETAAPHARVFGRVAPSIGVAACIAFLVGLIAIDAVTTSTEVAEAATALGLSFLAGRRLGRQPALVGVGVVVAAVAAWLVPQRVDPRSAVVLAVMFGLGAGLATSLRPLAARDPARRSLRKTVTTATVVVLATGGVTAYFGASTVDASWFGGGVTHGTRAGDEVAITFDDGPNVVTTPAIMKILDDAHVKGSFFVVGKALDAYPRIVRDLVAHGHMVGNHSYHHDQWRWLDPRYPELLRTQKAFAADVGVCPAWYRPPHGQRTPWIAREVHEHGMQMVMWDVSAADWKTTDAGLVARRVLRRVRAGSIIDLHDGFDGKPDVDRTVLVRAMPLILDGLRARHLRPVRLDELLGAPATTPCPSVTS